MHLQRNADTSVADLKAQTDRGFLLALYAKVNRNLSSLSEFERVADQIADHLAQTARIAV